MSARYLPFVLILAAYFGVEALAISRARHRTKADYIYPQLVAAAVAIERCGEASPDERARFDAVTARERRRLVRELGAGEPPPDSAEVEGRIATLRGAAEAELVAALETEGCDGPSARRSLGHFRIYKSK